MPTSYTTSWDLTQRSRWVATSQRYVRGPLAYAFVRARGGPELVRLSATEAPDTIGSMLDKNAHLDFTCPNCQHEWRERLDDVRRRPVRCPECDLELETAHFDRDMRDVERRLRDFGKRRS